MNTSNETLNINQRNKGGRKRKRSMKNTKVTFNKGRPRKSVADISMKTFYKRFCKQKYVYSNHGCSTAKPKCSNPVSKNHIHETQESQ